MGEKDTEIDVGMIGYGFMGRAHSNAFKTINNLISSPPAHSRLITISGRNEAAVRAAAGRFGFDSYTTDWQDLIRDDRIRLVDNTGPNDIHAEPCIAAANAGKHVLCEKPLARTAGEAANMLEAATKAGVKHMTGFNYRFVPAIRFARDLIQSELIGKIYHFRAVYLHESLLNPGRPLAWRNDRERAGSGVLGDLGSHIIDLARFLVDEPSRVSAITRTFIAERPYKDAPGLGKVTVDDAFAAAIDFRNGAIGTLEATKYAAGNKNRISLEINGEKGSMRFNLERLNELEIYLGDDEPQTTQGFKAVLVTGPDHPLMNYWPPRGTFIGLEHTFAHQMAHLLDAIANDKEIAPYGATFEDGYKAAVICDAILKSAETGHRVRIEY